jgi:hypothetical protein
MQRVLHVDMIHSVNIRIKHLYQMHVYTPEDGEDWNYIYIKNQRDATWQYVY